MNQYFIIGADGQQSGPHPGENLKFLGATAETYVWCEGMGGEWKKAGDVPELAPLFAANNPGATKPLNPNKINNTPAQPQANTGFGGQQQNAGFGGQQNAGFGGQQNAGFGGQQLPLQNMGFGGQQLPQQNMGYNQPQQQVNPQNFPQGGQPFINVNVQTNTGRPNPGLAPGKPENWMWLSVTTTLLCCLISGIVACVFSSRVDSQWAAGDYDAARQSAHTALVWNIVGLCTPLVGGIIYVIFILLIGMSL